MRVITGKYKGRHFEIPRTFKARPTTDFAKENLFNVMAWRIDFDGAACLDLFAGTGSISLELLSRGAAEVTSVEADRAHMAFIRACIEKVGAANSTLVCDDVFHFVKTCKKQFNFIFADPPYTLPNLSSLPAVVLDGGLLAGGGFFVLEHGKQHDFSGHPLFRELRCYGSVHFSIFG